jgi:hypothetical protein
VYTKREELNLSSPAFPQVSVERGSETKSRIPPCIWEFFEENRFTKHEQKCNTVLLNTPTNTYI